MEVFGTNMVVAPTNVIYLSSVTGQDGPNPVHKCDWKCQNENIFGNMYLCKLTGFNHICDSNCNQRILYDNHTCVCRVSKKFFPLTPVERQAVKGVRRKLETESCPQESCSFKRGRDARSHLSLFQSSFTSTAPICSQIVDGMDMS